ncbi:hypothetical protein M6B38_234680 [Iris pallida]|uniref:Uncharacterized protein n=1 Tax=Iris pallida TaxID=29817 RepID=A0AAX6DPU8_IRIPA|nr:hypothetical protein M6B38_234680 [Iris pallida]
MRSRRRTRVWNSEFVPRRSNFAHVFLEIRPLDRRFLCSVAISFRGANFVSLYLLRRSSVWRATSSCGKLDSVASVGPSILISSGPQASTFTDSFHCLDIYYIRFSRSVMLDS